MRAIRLVVVSANLLIRAGIQQVAAQSQNPHIEVAAALSEFKSLRKIMDEGIVDVVFIDDALPPNINLVRIIQTLVKDQPGLAVIVTLNRPTKSLYSA
ncbi:MAG: hypothetical protein KME04_14165 [Pleurocapsa minor GSE-CHR-MK-17-07R]|jgi:DNA-binding NarL/FixJ family response regulator|nr:hypothetical protein [Pleurocapsa minor GSE-CHR-MK 17-07R]